MAEYRSPLDSILDERLGIAQRKQNELAEASQRKKNEFNPINAGNLEHVDGDTWRLKDSGRTFRAGNADPATSIDTYESDVSVYDNDPNKFRSHRRAYSKLTGKPEFLVSKDEMVERGKAQAAQTAQRMEAAANEGKLGFRTFGVDAYGRDLAEVVDTETGQPFFDAGREQNAGYYSKNNAGQRVRDIFGGVEGEYEAFSGGRGPVQATKDQFGNLTSGALNMANDLLQAASIVTGARSQGTDEFFENNRGRIEKVKEYLVSEEQLSRERRDQRNAARNVELYDVRKQQYLDEGLSDSAASIRAGTDEFMDSIRDMITNPGAILDKTVESLPYMIGVGLAGRAATKAASASMRKKVKKEVLQAGASGEQAVASAARYASSKAGKKTLGRIATATGVGTVGLTEGLSTGASIYSSILNMSEKEAMQSEKYQVLRLDQGMKHKEALQVLAEEAFDSTFLTAVAVAGGASLITGAAAFESKLFTRMADVRKDAVKAGTSAVAREGSRGLTRSIVGETLKKGGQYTKFAGPAGLKEAAEESIQSGSSEFLTQLSQFETGVGDEPGAGIGRAAGEGAVIGFASGAGARSVSGGVKKLANTNIRKSGLTPIQRVKPGTREEVVDRSGTPGGSKAAAVAKTKNLSPQKANTRFNNILKTLDKTDRPNSAALLRKYNEAKQYVDKIGEDNLTEEQSTKWEATKAAYVGTLDNLSKEILKKGIPLEKLEKGDKQILQSAIEEDVPSVRGIAKNDNALGRVYKQTKRVVKIIKDATSKALENAGQFNELDSKYANEQIAQEKMGRGLASNNKPGLLGHYDLISEAIVESKDSVIRSRSEDLVNFIKSQERKLNDVGEAITKKADHKGVTYKEGATEAYYNTLRGEMEDMVAVRNGLRDMYIAWQGEQGSETIETPVAEAPVVPSRKVGIIDGNQASQGTVVAPKRGKRDQKQESTKPADDQSRAERSAGSETGTQQEASSPSEPVAEDTEGTPETTETQSESSESRGTESTATDVDLDSLRVPELVRIARENGITLSENGRRKRKQQLIDEIRNAAVDEATQAEIEETTAEQAAQETALESQEEGRPAEEPTPDSTAATIFDEGDFQRSLVSIWRNSDNPLYSALAERLLTVLDGRNIKVTTLNDDAFKAKMEKEAPELSDASAAFLSESQEIVLRNKYRNHDNMEQAFLHEATHAAVNGWMTRPKTSATEKALHNRAQTLRKNVLKGLRKGAKENPNDPRWSDVLRHFEENQEEWITYAWSNPEAQEILREIPMSKTLTALDGILKIIKDILGLEGRTALSHVLAVSDKIFESNIGQQGRSPREGATYTPSAEAVEQAREILEAEGVAVEQAEAEPERSSEAEPEGQSAEEIAKNDFYWDLLRETQRLTKGLESGRLQEDGVAFLNSEWNIYYQSLLRANSPAGALAQIESVIRERLNENLPRTQAQTAELKMPEIIRLAQSLRTKGTVKAASQTITTAEPLDTETGFEKIKRWITGDFNSRPNIKELIRERLADLGLPVSVNSGFRQASKVAKSLITAVPNLHEVLANPDARRELYDALELNPTEEKAFETFRNFRNEFSNAVNQAFDDLTTGRVQYPDGNRIEQNPAYLLTDMAGVMDPAAVTAMAYESMNWLGGDGQRLTNDADAIQDILGLPDNYDMTPEQKRLTTAGTLRRNVISSLGRATYRHLNLAALQGPEVSPNLDERMEQALGALALRALIVANRVEQIGFDGKEFAKMKGEIQTEHENYTRPVNFVRIMSEGRTGQDRFYHSDLNADLIDDSRPGRTVFTRLFGVSDVIKEPLKEVPTDDNIPKKALRSLMVVSKKLQAAIGYQQRRPWTTDSKMIETLRRFDNMQDFLAAAHEYQLNMNEVHAIDKDAVTARNRTLETMFENALKWYDENGTDEFFLTYFVTKTGRTNMGSTFVDPQSSKLHRFIFRQKAWDTQINIRDLKMDEEVDLLNNFKIAVALGMDFKIDGKGVDKLTQDEVISKIDEYMDSKSVQDALEQLARDGPIILAGETNPLAKQLQKEGTHTLAALLAWQEYTIARDSGAKSFRTSLPMEVDGVTNGFAAGLLQTPPMEDALLERVKDLSRATGMYYDDDTVRSLAQWLQDPANRDNYQAAARLMAVNLRELSKDPDVSAVIREHLGPDIAQLLDQKTGRDFAKNPLMIIAYGAGFKSVRRNMVNRLVGEMYNNLAKVSSKPEAEQMKGILDVLNRAVRVMNAGQRELFDRNGWKLKDFQVKDTYTSEDVQDIINDGDLLDKETGKPVASLSQFAQNFQFGESYDKDKYVRFDMSNLNHGLNMSYGEALEQSLQTMLAGIRPIRDTYNHSVMLMNAIFRVEFDRRVDLQERRSGRVIGRRQRSEILNQMHREGLVPSIRTAYSKSLDENLELTAYDHELLPDEAVKVHHPRQRNVSRRWFSEENPNGELRGDTGSTTSRLTTRTPSMDVGVAGIVGDIHSLDGTNSADVFGKYPVLNVFDAWVMGLNNVNEVPNYGNQRFAQQHKEYDMGQELLTSVNRMMLLMEAGEGRLSESQKQRVAQLFSDAMEDVGQLDQFRSEDMSPEELVNFIYSNLQVTVPAVTNSRNKMFGTMRRSGQFSHDLAAYELSAEERGTPVPQKETPEDYVRETAAAQKVETKAATLASNMAEDGNLEKAFFNWLQEEAVRPREALRVIARAMEMAGVAGSATVNDLLAVLHEHLDDSNIIKIGRIADPFALGQYRNGEITIDESKFTDEDNPLETLLHEIVHAATDEALIKIEAQSPELLDQLNKDADRLVARLKAQKNLNQAQQDTLESLLYQKDKVIRVGEFLAYTLTSLDMSELGLVFNNTQSIQDAFLTLGQVQTRGNRENAIIRSSQDKVNNKLFDTAEQELLEADKLWENMEAMVKLDSNTDVGTAEEYRDFIAPVMDDVLIPGLASLTNDVLLELGIEPDGTQNLGEVQRGSDKDVLRVQATGAKLTNNGGMSNQEVLAHELYHAVTGYTIEQDTKVRAELRKIYESVKDRITWEDFMPEVTVGNRTAVESAAKARYDYIFGVPQRGVDQLQEFAAIGLSNQAFALTLSRLNAPTAFEPLWDGNILSFLVNVISRGLELLRSEQIGTRRALNASDALTKLSQKIVTINKQAQARTYDKAGHKGMWRNASDAKASEKLMGMLDAAQEKLRLTEEEAAEKGSVLRWLRMGTHAALAQRTDAQQRANAEFLRHMGVNKSGNLAQIITEVLPYNKDDRGGADGKIGFLDLLRKSKVEVDIARQRAIEHTRSSLMEHFDPKRNLTLNQRVAITNAVLRTDLVSLMEHNKDRTHRDIHQMLKNEALVTAEIARLERELQTELGRQNATKALTMFQRQIHSLAKYQTTGEMGEVNGMKNAHNIVHQYNLLYDSERVVITDPEKLIPLVDQLATLRAIEATPRADIDFALQVIDHEMNRTDDNGFFFTLGMAQDHKDLSLEKLFKRNPIHMRKGYVYDMTDGDINVEVIMDNPLERQRMEDLGMVEIGIVDKDPRDRTTTGRRVLYKGYRGANTWQKSTVSLTSRQAQGTPLFEVAGFDPKETRYALGTMKGLSNQEARKQFKQGAVDPREKLAIPVLDEVGNIVDYTYEMPLATKQEHLKNDRHNDYFDQVIPRQFGAIADKVGTKEINSDVANLLYKEWQAFKDSSEHSFVLIGKNSPDKRGREMYQLLPTDMKRELAELFRGTEFNKGFPIRDDAVNLVLGFRKLSILDIPSGRGDDRRLIRGKNATFAARTAEKIWQEIMQLVRIKMAIINPTVVIGNLSSNFGILLAEGIPVRYIKDKTTEAIRSMRQYQRDVKRIDTLEREIGVRRANSQSTLALVKERERLIAEIRRNPVGDLVKEGLFTSIVEDVTSDEDTYREWIVSRGLDRAKGALPGKAVQLAKEAYMIPGSNAFNMAIAATQYGDFIGRYVKFKYETEVKNTPRRDAINGALASFIYYDMPQNRWLQMMNDNGFFIFTKFFLRIQPVVAKLFQDNPLKATGVLAAQQALMNPFDENIGTFALFQGIGNRFEPIPFRHIGKLAPTEPSLFQWLWPLGL